MRQLGQDVGAPGAHERLEAVAHHAAGVLARHRQHALARDAGLHVGAAQDRVDRLLDEIGLSFLDHEDRVLALRELDDLPLHQRIGHIEHAQRHARAPERVGKADQLEPAQHRVVEAALHHDADVGKVAGEEFVELLVGNELHRRRPALLDLLLLVQVGRRRQRDAADVAARLLHRVLQGE